jgi:hypothetical protein
VAAHPAAQQLLLYQPFDFAVSMLQLDERDSAAADNTVDGLEPLEQLQELMLFCQPVEQEQRLERADDGNDVLQLEAVVVLAPFGELQQQLQQLKGQDEASALAAVKQMRDDGRLCMLSDASDESTCSVMPGTSKLKALHIVSRFAVNEQQQQQRNMLLDRAAARASWQRADAGARQRALLCKVVAHVRWGLQHSDALRGLQLAQLQPVV